MNPRLAYAPAVNVRAEIGRRIAEARARAGGMTQEELGSRIGLSARGVQEIERDRSNPYRHVRAVAEATGVSVEWLLHGVEPEPQREADETLLRLLGSIDARLGRLEAAIDRLGRENQ